MGASDSNNQLRIIKKYKKLNPALGKRKKSIKNIDIISGKSGILIIKSRNCHKIKP